MLIRGIFWTGQLHARVCDRKRAFDATRNRGRNDERQFLFKSRNFPFHHYYDKKYRRQNCFYVSRGNSMDIAKRKSLQVLSIYRNLFIFVKKNHTFENFFIISYMQLVDKYFSYFSYCRIFFYKLLHCKIMRFTSVRNFIYHIRNSSKILYFPCSYLIQIKIFKNKTKTGKN